jgi:hypothetical protein
MAEKNNTFTPEERAKQLRKCCETIMEKADDIMREMDFSVERTITIHFPVREVPTIEIKQNLISKKMIESCF